ARAALEPVATEHAPQRVCRLMAQLEEEEHGDLKRAHEWLMRASLDELGDERSPRQPERVVAHLEPAPAAATSTAPSPG
ncbi:MAG: hypothetical protein ACXW1N_08895, partial [Halobacteriota archaeon]